MSDWKDELVIFVIIALICFLAIRWGSPFPSFDPSPNTTVP